MNMEDEFVGSSYHFNDGRRMMTREEEESINWDDISSAEIPIIKDFLKLCFVQDDIWTKIEEKLPKPVMNDHTLACACCSTNSVTERNIFAIRKEMRELHKSMNNDMLVMTAVLKDISRVTLQEKDEE